MKGRVGVIVLAVVGLFIAGAVALRPAKREKRPAPPKPVEATTPSTQPTATPQPVSTDDPPAESVTGLQIEVVNREGKPIAGARVLHGVKHAPALGTTDEGGLVVIPFSAIEYQGRPPTVKLRVEHDSYAPHFEKVTRSEVRVRIVLRASAIVDLEVVSKSAMPLGDAEVRVDEMESGYLSHPAHPATKTWKTEDNGRVRITGIPTGALVIRAQAKGYEEGRTFVVVQEGEPRSVRLELSTGRRLNVLVRTSSGEPVANAKVEFSDGSTWGMSSSTTGGYRTYYWVRTSDKKGTASFDFIPATMAKGVLRAQTPMHSKASKQIDLTPTVTEAELTLEPGGKVSVDVVDPEGKSVACKIQVSGPGVDWNDAATVKDKVAGEKALFEGLPAGSQVAFYVYRHGGMVHLESGINVISSQTTEVTIRIPAQCKVTIVARDKQGKPVSGNVGLSRVKGALGPPVAGLRNDYLYYGAPLPESGTAEVSVLVGVYKCWFQPFEGVKVQKEARIEGDTTLEFEVVSNASLSGIVVDSGGAPLAGITVQWGEEGGNWGTTTGSDGRFTINRIFGSLGKLHISFGGVTLEAYAGAPTPSELRLVFPMSTIRGRAVRPSGEPGWGLVYFQPIRPHFMGGDGTPPVSTRRDGSFEMRLPSGIWNISVFAEDSVPNPRPMQVDLSAPGNIVDVTYELQAAPKSP